VRQTPPNLPFCRQNALRKLSFAIWSAHHAFLTLLPFAQDSEPRKALEIPDSASQQAR
jgi:hypothetical protein